MFDFVIQHLPQLATKTVEQLYLVLGSISMAILMSVPLGIWVMRVERLRGTVLGVASVLQTIPSLAILALLIPILGIGVKPALITLCLYAILPIVRNTVMGLSSVSPLLIEAADGIGLTKNQRLWKVELPIAMPIIIGGIRTATTMNVGIATIAAFIGAGGLGDFIYEGLSLFDHRLILLGAIPTALLALLLDYCIGRMEAAYADINRSKARPTKKSFFNQAAFASVLVILLIKPIGFLMMSNDQVTVRIGARNFTEQLIVAELMAQLIEENKKFKVKRQFTFSSPSVAHFALKNKNIDLYPEYTGTAYVVMLHGDLENAPKDMFHYLQTYYHANYGIDWLPPFGFNNANALAIRSDLAEKYQLKTISDLYKHNQQFTIGVAADFYRRADGYVGLSRCYGLNFGQTKLMEVGLMYQAVANAQVDMIMGYSTDGRISAYHLKILEDDRSLFPEYRVSPLARSEFLAQYPEVRQALKPLFHQIDNKKMLELNEQVDIKHQTPAFVAKQYLKTQGFIR